MRLLTAFFTIVWLLAAPSNRVSAQTFDLHFVVVTNDGTNYAVKIQMRSSSTFSLGSSNLYFTYNSAALSTPVLHTAWNFSGGSYFAMSITPTGDEVSVNIVLNSPGSGSTVPTTYTDVATIQFNTTDPAGNSNLLWDGSNTVVFKDDESTIVGADSLINLDTNPLPIQLSTFTSTIGNLGAVNLQWSTLSEVSNYGFFVQRHSGAESTFKDLPNSFVPGHGTTIRQYNYTFTDNTLKTDTLYVYRLRQQDLDGTVHYYPSITVSGAGLGLNAAPRVFQLFQNYPNPFNPETSVKFSVEKSGRATLRVYNIIGQQVTTLFDDVAQAGQYYTVRFNGSAVASGVYFFRLQNSGNSSLRKMLLMK